MSCPCRKAFFLLLAVLYIVVFPVGDEAKDLSSSVG